MIDYELTDLLIELEEIQQDQSFNLARGQQVADLLDFYEIPSEFYTLKQEPANGRRRSSAGAKSPVLTLVWLPPSTTNTLSNACS